jgi:hypothetical protein
VTVGAERPAIDALSRKREFVDGIPRHTLNRRAVVTPAWMTSDAPRDRLHGPLTRVNYLQQDRPGGSYAPFFERRMKST